MMAFKRSQVSHVVYTGSLRKSVLRNPNVLMLHMQHTTSLGKYKLTSRIAHADSKITYDSLPGSLRLRAVAELLATRVLVSS